MNEVNILPTTLWKKVYQLDQTNKVVTAQKRTKCQGGYYLTGDDCEQCNKGCNKCDGGTSKCSECSSGYYASKSNIDGNSDLVECSKCPDQCETCSFASRKVTCEKCF